MSDIPRMSEFNLSEEEEELLRNVYQSKFLKGLLNGKTKKEECVINLFYEIGVEDYFIYEDVNNGRDSDDLTKRHLMNRAIDSAMLQLFLKDARSKTPFEKNASLFKNLMNGLDVNHVLNYYEQPMETPESMQIYHGTPNKDLKTEQLGKPNENGVYVNKDGVGYWTTDFDYASKYKEHGDGNGIVHTKEMGKDDACRVIPRTDGGACFIWQEELIKMSNDGVKYLFSSNPNEHDVLDISSFSDFVEKRDRCVEDTIQKYDLGLPDQTQSLFRIFRKY